jgi:UDP-hydrolysing UDP-N-acetyl-D-glucosamine 2-epimerase
VRKICFFIGSRANYASIKSVLSYARADAEIEFQVILAASAVIDRFGDLRAQLESQQISIDAEIFMLLEGDRPLTMAKSAGLGIIELATALDRLAPDVVIIVGDRFETIAMSIAAAYMNCPIAHTMGGEVSGTIDESIRHANTKFAQIHFCATELAKQRIIKMGEDSEKVFNVGCPRVDVAKEVIKNVNLTKVQANLNSLGVGDVINLEHQFLVVSQHPVTTEYVENSEQIQQTIAAVQELQVPAIFLWPNSDAGNEQIAREYRKTRERGGRASMRFIKNLAFEDYISLLATTRCLVGNSSSGIREGGFIGTPVVNIGSRQHDREHAANVLTVAALSTEISSAIKVQIEHGHYPSDTLYGDGCAAGKITKILKTVDLTVQKRLAY